MLLNGTSQEEPQFKTSKSGGHGLFCKSEKEVIVTTLITIAGNQIKLGQQTWRSMVASVLDFLGEKVIWLVG